MLLCVERDSILTVSAATLLVFLVVGISGGHPELVTEVGKNTFRIVRERRRWHYFVGVAQVGVIVKALRERYNIFFILNAALTCCRNLLGAAILVIIRFLK